jgi:hypothetical protein
MMKNRHRIIRYMYPRDLINPSAAAPIVSMLFEVEAIPSWYGMHPKPGLFDPYGYGMHHERVKGWWWLLSPRVGHIKLPKALKIVGNYWHNRSLESSWGALSDGTISFPIHPYLGEKCIYWIFLKKPQSCKKGLNFAHTAENGQQTFVYKPHSSMSVAWNPLT